MTDDRALPLAEMRRWACLTQTDLAAAMGTTQAAVSRIERQKDVHLSTFVRYLRALGGLSGLRSVRRLATVAPEIADPIIGPFLIPMRLAVAELDKVHRPADRADVGPHGGCVTCWPKDGWWPCATRRVADDLRAVLGEISDE